MITQQEQLFYFQIQTTKRIRELVVGVKRVTRFTDPQLLYRSEVDHIVSRLCLVGERDYQEPTETRKQPIKTRYLGHVTGYQPIRDQYLIARVIIRNARDCSGMYVTYTTYHGFKDPSPPLNRPTALGEMGYKGSTRTVAVSILKENVVV
eukprot:sb/3473540/